MDDDEKMRACWWVHTYRYPEKKQRVDYEFMTLDCAMGLQRFMLKRYASSTIVYMLPQRPTPPRVTMGEKNWIDEP